MEFIAALGLFVLAFAGLASGLMLAGRPPRTSCGGLSCEGRCDACPNKAGEEAA